MADKKKLDDMVDALINKKDDQAEIAFHGYLEDKMKEVLNPGAEVDVEAEADVKVDDEEAEAKKD